MNDIEASVAGRLFTAFINAYPSGSYSGEPNIQSPARWPHLNVVEVDNYFYTTNLDAEQVVYDINVFSNKTSGAKQECKEIMALVNDTMLSFGTWERVFCNQTKNADNKIYRMTARYRGVAVKESDENDVVTYRIYRN